MSRPTHTDALQRGRANTRWRDFADIYLLLRQERLEHASAVAAIAAVAHHRGILPRTLRASLDGMAEEAQGRWARWVERQGLIDRVPRSFEQVLEELDVWTRGWMVAAADEGGA